MGGLIVVADPVAPELAAGLPGWDVREVLDPGELPGALAAADALVVRSRTRVTAGLLEHAPRLRVIGRAGAGLDGIDLEAAAARGIAVVAAGDAAAAAVAELTVGLMVALARDLSGAAAAARAGRWQKRPGMGLAGRTLGIAGLGRVGTRVARAATALGMRVVALERGSVLEAPRDERVDAQQAPREVRDGSKAAPRSKRHAGPAASSEHHDDRDAAQAASSEHHANAQAAVHGSDEATSDADLIPRLPLRTLLAESDVLTLHLPLTAATRGLIDAAALARLPSGALLINTARGALIDEVALLAALDQGHLAGAALDVLATEPPAPDHPLLHHPRVLVTPHLGASTADAQRAIARELAGALRRALGA